MGKSSKAILAMLAMASVIFFVGCEQKNQEQVEENDMYDGPDKAIEFEIERTKDPSTGKVPWNKLLLAIQQTEQAKGSLRNSPNTINLLSWIERGPDGDFYGPQGNSRPAGQQTAGRIRAAIVDSLDPTHKTVWIGGIDGGIWKTTDITASPANWVLINDFLSNLAVSAICQDPRPGFQNIMYFCTGESFSNADAVRGVGVFKSTNGGATWNFLPSTSSYISGTRIVCDAQGNVYLGTRNTGLLRSTNGGTSWTDITPSGIGTSVCDLEISSTGRMHVATGIFSTSGYRYTDIPATVTSGGWTTPTTPFTTFNQRTEFAVNGNILYACPDNSSHQVPTIWKSIDGGDNWASTGGQPASGWASGQGWYSLSVGINPANTDECIVGGLDCHKTTNGGNSWVKISAWVGTAGPYVHADQHNIQWWDGGAKLMFTCDGGVHFSTNGGTTINDRNKGLRLKQFYSVAIHPVQTNYFLAGAQDNGVHRLDHPGLDSSIEVYGGDGCYVAIDQNEPQYQFGSYVYNVYRRSTNNGVSWSTPVNNTSTGRFVNPWDYDNNTNIVYACNTTGNYLRWDNPQTGGTTTVVTATGFNGNVSAVHASPYTPHRVYFGMGSGGIFIVDNANVGTTVSATDITPSGASGYANCVVTGSSDQNLLACYSSYGVNNVWVSSNGGTTWTAIDGNLPDMPVRWALFHPDDNGKAFIATETGVWETDLINGSSTVWNPSTSFPTVRTDMIKYRPSDRTIAAGTHGRGIWSAQLPPNSGFDFDNPPPATATCPAPSSMSITLGTIAIAGFSNPITLTGSGNPAGTLITFGTNPVNPGGNSLVTLTGTNLLAPGTYTITVTGTATGAPQRTRNLSFIINPGTPPAITLQPVSQAVCAGTPVTFTTAATGGTGYQWQVSTDGGLTFSNIPGETNASYTIASVTAAMNNYQYRAIVTGACANATTNVAILTVNSAPSISAQPQSTSICTGTSTTLCVTATGTNLTYQWQSSPTCSGPWTNIPGANANCYTATLTSTTAYQVQITSGSCGSVTSGCATVTVVTQPAITGQPANQTICDGGNTSFTVTASGTGLNYQWQVSTDGGLTFINVSNGGVYSGATSNTLNITGGNVSMNNYRYRVVVTNPSCTSPATSSSVTLTVNSLPAISTQPQSVTICAGSNNTFNVTASGTGITYQWQFSTDGGITYTNIPGATSSSYTVSSAASAMNGYRYRVVVSGTCTPPATSTGAILTVIDAVAISPTGQPKDSAVCETGNAAFTVNATSVQPISYQWQVSTDGGTTWINVTNGGVYSGVNTATLSLTGVTAAMNNYRYRVLLSNTTCTSPVNSNASRLTVNARPTVTLSASPYTKLYPGLSTTITATILPSASGFNITWTRNGSVLSGVTGTSYTADVTKLGNYQVSIVNTVTGCNNQSNILSITDSASSRLFIYPSPNDGRFTVSYYNSTGSNTKRTIVVFDSKGSRVHSEQFNISGPYTLLSIDLRPAQTGIYYVSVYDLSGKRIAEGKVLVH